MSVVRCKVVVVECDDCFCNELSLSCMLCFCGMLIYIGPHVTWKFLFEKYHILKNYILVQGLFIMKEKPKVLHSSVSLSTLTVWSHILF